MIALDSPLLQGLRWPSFALASASPAWVEAVAGKAAQAGLLVVGAIIVWLVGRLAIRAVTRSIRQGLPMTKEASKALAKARIGSAPVEDGLAERLEADRRRKRARTIGSVLNSGLVSVVVTVLVVMLLELAGLPIAPLLASAGILGVALGFGAQSLVKDLLSGVFLLAEDQYGVGDIVDLGDASGTVEDVGLRTTRLRSLDGTVWFVPNGEIRRVGNQTKLWSRALIETRLEFDADMDKARKAMIDAVAAARKADAEVDAAIIGEPEVPGVEAIDYDAVLVRLIVQVKPGTQWAVMRAVRIQMRALFAKRGIRMALPDHTLYLDKAHPANRGPKGGESTT